MANGQLSTPLGSTTTSFFVVFITLIAFAAHFQLLRHSPSPRIVDNLIRHQQSSSTSTIMSIPYEDYVKGDYKAFVFATHPTYGMLLLYCTRKKTKPPHFQAPGGHVDREDFEETIANTPESSHQGPALLVHASKIGAARELFEETGIDIRSALDRLQPVRLRERDNSDDKLICELKKRLFFKICLEDSDFESKISVGLSQPLNNKPPHLMIKLSHEHQGFKFESDATKTVDFLIHHSGGKVSKALRKAIEQGEIESIESEVDDTAKNDVENDENMKIVGNPRETERDDKSEKKGKFFNCFNC